MKILLEFLAICLLAIYQTTAFWANIFIGDMQEFLRRALETPSSVSYRLKQIKFKRNSRNKQSKPEKKGTTTYSALPLGE